VWFHEHLLPSLRLHGWYPGASLGHPLLLYYFPFPFLLMSSLAPLVGMPVAFKLGTALGVFLLPLLVYGSFRLMRLSFPAPLLGAGAALVFLYVEDNPIWGGTIASTLTGEFAYTYGVGFAILFLGSFPGPRRWVGPWAPVVLGSPALHGYAVLWAGLAASGCCSGTPRAPLAVADLGWLWRSPRWPSLRCWPSCLCSRTGADDALPRRLIDLTDRVLPAALRPPLRAGSPRGDARPRHGQAGD
jgi:hypothetical protein